MEILPALLLGLDEVPVQPASRDDLENLAQEDTLQAVLTALNALAQLLPRPSTAAHQVELDLGEARTDEALDLGGLTRIQAVTVIELTGTAHLKLGGPEASPLRLGAAQVRSGLDVAELRLTNDAQEGLVLLLELHGVTTEEGA